eukprot:1582838-Pyramimonas_sp.AAC.1
MEIVAVSSRHIPKETCDLLVSLAIEHNRCAQIAGAPVKPKSHLFVRMSMGARFKGNPQFLQAYADESLNNPITRIAARSHRL